MKVISIESPQRLKDRTVKATIIVDEYDFVPLIMLADRAYKGDAIIIDDAKGEYRTEDTPLSIIMDTIIDASMAVIESQLNIAEKVGYQKAMEEIKPKENKLKILHEGALDVINPKEIEKEGHGTK